ncbi:MAG: hypothetical protein ACI93R_001701 [Flavobacteriales bacterium]|jgi:hypothetical protein
MDTTLHKIEDLFLRLGIPNSPQAIEAFVKNIHLTDNMLLEQSAVWSEGQAQFIHQALAEDSDWHETLDHLSSQLRH